MMGVLSVEIGAAEVWQQGFPFGPGNSDGGALIDKQGRKSDEFLVFWMDFK